VGNRGDGIRMAVEVGADTSGQFDMIHAEPWENTFEKVGFEIWKNQGQQAFWIADAKTLRIPGIEAGWLSGLAPERCDSLAELADRFGLDHDELTATIDQFNRPVTDDHFDWRTLDGKHTEGLEVPKSNWAVRIDEAPFIGFPLTGVICFTFGGVRTDADARVVTPNGVPIPGLYAAGELTGLFYHEYPVATSVLRSLTFGRIAARHALAARTSPACATPTSA
jgi:tricarballylate dehydrogenase